MLNKRLNNFKMLATLDKNARIGEEMKYLFSVLIIRFTRNIWFYGTSSKKRKIKPKIVWNVYKWCSLSLFTNEISYVAIAWFFIKHSINNVKYTSPEKIHYTALLEVLTTSSSSLVSICKNKTSREYANSPHHRLIRYLPSFFDYIERSFRKMRINFLCSR